MYHGMIKTALYPYDPGYYCDADSSDRLLTFDVMFHVIPVYDSSALPLVYVILQVDTGVHPVSNSTFCSPWHSLPYMLPCLSIYNPLIYVPFLQFEYQL
jgi:hypothetical protein